MTIRQQTPEDGLTSSADAVADLPVAVFVERWRLITGEPPAAMLSSRSEMLAMLVKCTPAAPLEPPILDWDGLAIDGRTAR